MQTFDILIPTFNRKPILEKNLYNISQRPDRQFINKIFVCDSSEDDCRHLLDKFSNETKLNTVYINGRGLSLPEAKNKLLLSSETPYPIFIDDDVFVKDNCLIELENSITQLPNAIMVGATSTFYYYIGYEKIVKKNTPYVKVPNVSCCHTVDKKKIIDNELLYNADYPIAEDVEQNIRCILKGFDLYRDYLALFKYYSKNVTLQGGIKDKFHSLTGTQVSNTNNASIPYFERLAKVYPFFGLKKNGKAKYSLKAIEKYRDELKRV